MGIIQPSLSRAARRQRGGITFRQYMRHYGTLDVVQSLGASTSEDRTVGRFSVGAIEAMVIRRGKWRCCYISGDIQSLVLCGIRHRRDENAWV